jgi:hypothetical protein
VTGPHATWLRQNYGIAMNADQERCLEVLCALGPLYCLEHHLVGKRTDRFELLQPNGLAVRFRGDLATFDADALTRLVVRAHAKCVRVAISPSSKWSVWVILHARKPDGVNFYDRHPTLADALERYQPEANR